MHRSLRRNLVIGLAVLAVAALAGGAYAATQNSGPSSRQAFLNDVAKRLHVTPKQLTSALSGAAIDQIQAAVSAGTLTQAQANALEQRLKSGAPVLPFGPIGPLIPHTQAVPQGVPGPRGFFPPNAVPGIRAPGGLGGAATYLGLTDQQLFQQLAGGKSLAQIAASKGKSVSGLESAMTAAETKMLDGLVSSKAITKAMEKQILSRWSSTLSKRVNAKGYGFGAGPVPFFRKGGYGVPGAPGGPGGPGKPGWPAIPFRRAVPSTPQKSAPGSVPAPQPPAGAPALFSPAPSA